MKIGKCVTLALMFGLALSTQASASDQSAGYITNIDFAGGRFLFWVDSSRTTRPSCDCCSRWEIVPNTPEGQAQLSLVMLAFSMQKQVEIYGTGTCVGTANDTEGVGYFHMVP